MKNWDENLILTDCDGCLLDWEWAFSTWMQERGFTLTAGHKKTYALHHHYNDLTAEEAKMSIKRFNESAAIGFLPALRDATYYVKRLHEEHGYRFRCITSLSLDKNAQKLREMNLHKIFGDAIESVICLDTGADKDEALAPYEGSGLWWIEDKFANYELGLKLGLNAILVEHGHNMDERITHGGHKVRNWKEIYALLER